MAMQHPLALLLLTGFVGGCATPPPRSTTTDLLLAPGNVLFLGDSITWDGRFVADFEACWRATHPGAQAEFLQLGLPSETVSGLSEAGHAGGDFPRPALDERLERTLAAIRPQLVFACYGMNDGIYAPLDPERFAAFRSGIERLEQACAEAGAALVLLTPPWFDGTRGAPAYAGYDDVLAAYSAWLVQHGREVVDVHTAMRDRVAARRAEDPAFTLASDGVHPGDFGHWLMARELLVHVGVAGARAAPSCEHFLASVHAGPELRRLVGERQRLLRDAWLRSIGHRRPGLPAGVPLDEAQARATSLAADVQRQLPRAADG
jgi:lysophospholipase L1-like esterase